MNKPATPDMSTNQQKFSAFKCTLSFTQLHICIFAQDYDTKFKYRTYGQNSVEIKSGIRSVTMVLAGQDFFDSKHNVCCCFNHWKKSQCKSPSYILIFLKVIYEYAISIND